MPSTTDHTEKNEDTRRKPGDIPGEFFHDVDLRPSEVLVVEDDEDMRELIALMLSDRGYQTVKAVDGEHAFKILQRRRHRNPIDAIVMDMWMPGLTGLDLMEHLRTEDWSTPVIFVSAFVTGHVYSEAKRLGAHRVIPKPLKLQELADAVEEAAPPVWS
ncbi:MAG: response regulator [Myxococcota bacterium]